MRLFSNKTEKFPTGKMEKFMQKVLIADDEERICRLVEALIDWKALDMEVAAIAHNGLEAVELVWKLRPDILITDIRMPGCSGLELIEKVKKDMPELEIIIISGYAHFEYAKSAIKYGVGEYLLKPINKVELTMTLERLKAKMETRLHEEKDRQQMERKNKHDVQKLRELLLERLLEQKEETLSLQILREEYYLQMQSGCFQAIWLKIDNSEEELGEEGRRIVIERSGRLLEGNLQHKCFDMLCKGQDWGGYVGILNYEKGRQEEIRRILKDCLNQLESGKKLYGDVLFSMAAGSVVSEPSEMAKSLKEASVIIEERLLKGTGRLLDYIPEESSLLHEKGLLEKYLRSITNAIEIMSKEEAKKAIEQLKSGVSEVKDVRGYELLELVSSCGALFLSRAESKERGKKLAHFTKRCRQCGSYEALFQTLWNLQEEYIQKLLQQREGDMVRPIRQAKQYIQNHYSEPITQEEVSSAVGLSSAYFSALFKKEEGEGFAKYLTGVRMEQAKILLRESNASVSEICRKVGYNDLKHFNHNFEKATGLKPTAYRKLYG